MAELRRAATDDYDLLFVRGIDPERPLDAQGDPVVGAPASRQSPIRRVPKVVRGFDRQHAGPAMSAFAITLDGGCGYGGKALVACLDPKGDILDLVEA
jgi:serine/threonine protein phosphatase 1